MKAIFCVLLLFALTLRADEAADRAAIDSLIIGLNDPAQRAASFTPDADSSVEFDHLVDLHLRAARATVIGTNESWTKLTQPRVVSGQIRFITGNVATVDGASLVDGAVTLARRVPLLFVVRKDDGRWRISLVRVVLPPLPAGRAIP